ncbi:MAG: cell division protein ZipA [Porticoccus sp.]|nr:MAG: cell division protein ZipA [Porticoccus sp.]
MEFGAREMMLALGVLVVLAIVLDVIRRVRNARYDRIHMSKRKQPIFDSDAGRDEYGSELPGGGARVVGYRNESDVEEMSRAVRQRAEANKPKLTVPFKKPEQSSLFQEDPVPPSRPVHVEPVETASVPTGEASVNEATEKDVVEKEASGRDTVEKKASGSERATRKPASVVSVVVMHLMAGEDKVFAGQTLLDALLAEGLRYGSMKIFHRHVGDDGSGPVLYSVANSVNPGTFDLNDMEQFTTPGVSFFFAMEDVDDPAAAFELLLGAARQMATDLGGTLKDESRSVLTRQTEEHYRQRIADYCRTQLSGIE